MQNHTKAQVKKKLLLHYVTYLGEYVLIITFSTINLLFNLAQCGTNGYQRRKFRGKGACDSNQVRLNS